MDFFRTMDELTFFGTGAEDGDILFTVNDLFGSDAWLLMSTAGSVAVEVSLNGEDWSGPIALQDFNTDQVPAVALATTPAGLYGARLPVKALRVKQSGATAATAILRVKKV